MKPISFPEQNIVFAKDQPQYQPLPAFRANTPRGEVISCWRLTFKERLRLLFTGKLWVSLLSFNQPLTPSFFTTKKWEVLIDHTNNLPRAKAVPLPPKKIIQKNVIQQDDN